MKLSLIAQRIGGRIIGDSDVEITGVREIGQARKGDLAFLLHSRYLPYLKTTRASALIVGIDFPGSFPTIVKVANPYRALAQVIEIFLPPRTSFPPGVHPTSVLSQGAKVFPQTSIGPFVFVGENTSIGPQSQVYPFVYIGRNCKIGKETTIFPQVFVGDGCEVGDRVIIHSGAVLGSDGFGFVQEGDAYRKIPQIGRVVVDDEVEIGANVAIDRATLGATRIGRGTKLDNLVHLGHNVQVGENTAIVAQVGISGSTVIGRRVKIAGQAGLVGHIRIGDNSTIAAQAGVTKSVPVGGFVSGYPARPHQLAKKIAACEAKLPDLFKKVKDFEDTLRKLKEKVGEQTAEDG